MGKAFEKQIKTIEGQGKKQVDALENLKLKPIEDKSNDQSIATTIFNELINKRKELMSELYDSVHYNNLKFAYVGPTNDVSFYEYKDSKEFFNMIKNSQIKFSEAKNKQSNFLKRLNEVKKLSKKIQLSNKEKRLATLKNFINLGKRLLTFLETILKCYQMQITMQEKMKLRGQGLKY